MASGNENTKGITVKSERELNLMREAGNIISGSRCDQFRNGRFSGGDNKKKGCYSFI